MTTLTTEGMWLLLIGFTALLVGALLIGCRIPRLRPLCVMVGAIAATHAVYYWLFLIWPDVLDGTQTMMFSIVIRLQILFTMALVLVMAVRQGRWQ